MDCQNSVCTTFYVFREYSAIKYATTMQPRFVTVDKMGGILKKRIWQPYGQCAGVFIRVSQSISIVPAKTWLP